MNESLKSILGAIVIFGCLGAITWLADPPDGETWQYKVRWISLVMIILPVPVLIWATRRKDQAPNFLGKLTRRYFERDGFCFTILPEVRDGVCWLTTYFQNRYEKPCRAIVVLKPSSFFFKPNEPTQHLALGIECEGGAFGKTSTPWPVPLPSQGKKASMDVAASVTYAQGRGRLLRYQDGLRVGTVKTDFWRGGLMVLGAMAGSLVISKPARVELVLPQNVAGELSTPPQARTETLWKLGDALPPAVQAAWQ